jgi:D-amino-acid oxidase
MRIAIVGGGIFGITASIILAKNHEVELFEKNNELLQSASGSNQYRIHRGYHYPRSPDTVKDIIESENSFKEVFSDAMLTNFEHYYCIAKENSLTSAKQFLDFCNKFQLEYTPSQLQFMNKDSIEMCIRVKESIYDPEKLKQVCWKKLKDQNVKIHLNDKVKDDLFKKFDRVVICTYAGINQLLKQYPAQQNEYQFELCEKPVVKLPESFKNKSVVIMDGPFMCIDPLGNTGLHLLCNVVHEIHQTNIGKYPSINKKFVDLIDKGIIKNPSQTNFPKFIESTIDFIPEITEAKHVGSMFTYRAVPPRVEETDARPTIVKEINNKIVTLFSGKITTCVEAARKVEKIFDKN